MSDEQFEQIKTAVLSHMRSVFEQMEEEAHMSHEEKYALLEDVLEQATDHDELRVAFEQWYKDHADNLELEFASDELWDHAINKDESEEDEEGEW